MSMISTPLRELLQKDVPWHWYEKHDDAVNELKKRLTKSPVLNYFDTSRPVVLTVDASQSGLGTALIQDSKPVASASRSLTKTEQHYAQIEKELLKISPVCIWKGTKSSQTINHWK